MEGIPIARLFSIEIRIHWSWVVILALVAVLVADGAHAIRPELDPAAQWLIAALSAAGFLASAMAHDLGHALVARRRGLPVPALSVSFFGGAAPFDDGAGDPGDEIAIATAGPVVSLAAGALLMAGSAALATLGGPPLDVAALFGLTLGLLNLLLGVLNLVPAYPLDGGRLFRAVIWRRTGDARRGSRVVSRAGSLIGLGLVGVGMVLLVLGDLANGLMVALCGWFLRVAARGGAQRLRLEELGDGVLAGDVMEPVGTSVTPGLTLDTFAQQMLEGESPRSAVTVRRGERIVGLIGISQLRRLRRSRWPQVRVEDVMIPREQIPALTPEVPIWPAFLRLRAAGIDAGLVGDPDAPAGLLTVRAIAAALEARRLGSGTLGGRP